MIARNRKAAHDYHLGESWEAGILLQGAEVKALRAGPASAEAEQVGIDPTGVIDHSERLNH